MLDKSMQKVSTNLATDRERLAAAIAAKMPKGCLLCGQPAAWAAFYKPLLQPPMGKVMIYPYVLCKECQLLPDSPQRVEQIAHWGTTPRH